MGGTDWNERGPDFDPDTGERMETPPPSAAAPAADSALHAAPTLAELYSAENLAADMKRPRVSVAALPGWPGGPAHGQGWGRALDRALGGLVPARVVLLGAAGAKAGKTSFLMQLVDGLALLTAERVAGRGGAGPLLPVLVLSEMTPAALTWRTLGRWVGCSSRIFGAAPDAELDGAEGLTDERRAEEERRIADRQAEGLAALSEGGALAASRRFLRCSTLSGPDAVRSAGVALDAWRDELGAETGRDVWPVLVVDPAQRFAAGDAGEVEALNALCDAIRAEADTRQLVVLMTSDTNKAAAKGDPEAGGRDAAQEVAAVLRGSYKLSHIVDAALVLRPVEDAGALPVGAARKVEVLVGLNRWGPSGQSAAFSYAPASGRFEASDEPARARQAPATEEKARTASDKAKKAEDAEARRSAARRKVSERAQTDATEAERKATAAELKATRAETAADAGVGTKADAEAARLDATNRRATATEARARADKIAAEVGGNPAPRGRGDGIGGTERLVEVGRP